MKKLYDILCTVVGLIAMFIHTFIGGLLIVCLLGMIGGNKNK
jgi:hypothetical protein